MSPSPAMMRCAASAMVCSPDEQKRFTVMPGTVCGSPARTAIWRAMFQPVAPSGLAQPMMTSSTSSGSTFARSSAAWTTWPPILAPWVLLSAPRQLLQSGVRAGETMTASVIRSSYPLNRFPSFASALADPVVDASLLPRAPLHAGVRDNGELPVPALADSPAVVCGRHVGHRERARRHAPVLQRAVDVLRARAFVHQEQDLLAVF